MRSAQRAIAAMALTGLVTAAGCGADNAEGPQAIRLANDPGMSAQAEGATDSAATGDATLMPAPVEYVFETSAVESLEGDTVSAWRLELPDDLPALSRRVASVLGIEDGEVREQDGAVVVEDGHATLEVSSSGDWHYLDRDAQLVEVCPSAPSGAGDNPEPGAAGAGQERAMPEAEDLAGDYDCQEPELSADVPSADEAEEAARALFAELDTAGPVTDLVSHASEHAVSVDGYVEVGGHPGALRVHVVFGSGGAVVSSGGTVGELVEVSGYPLASLATAVERLTAQALTSPPRGRELWPTDTPESAPAMPPDTPVSDDSVGNAGDGASSTAGGAAGGSVSGDPGPDDQKARPEPDPTAGTAREPAPAPDSATPEPLPEPAPEPAPDSAPEPAPDPATPEPEPEPLPEAGPDPQLERVEIVLVDIDLVLTAVRDVDAVQWLVPAYEFADEHGATWQVLAVADGYLEIEDAFGSQPMPVPDQGAAPEPGRAPAPEEQSGPDSGNGTAFEELAVDVLGLSEQDAVERLEAAGAIVRVLSRDEQEFGGTQDLRSDRVNLRIEEGLVSEASVG